MKVRDKVWNTGCLLAMSTGIFNMLIGQKCHSAFAIVCSCVSVITSAFAFLFCCEKIVEKGK